MIYLTPEFLEKLRRGNNVGGKHVRALVGEVERLRKLVPRGYERPGACNNCGADYGQECDAEKSCSRHWR